VRAGACVRCTAVLLIVSSSVLLLNIGVIFDQCVCVCMLQVGDLPPAQLLNPFQVRPVYGALSG
jgi:hypothetical protein